MTTRTCGGCDRPVADAYLCTGCTKELAARFAALPDLIEDLGTTAYRQDRVIVHTGSRGSGRPLPYREIASRLMSDVARHMAHIAARHKLPSAWRVGYGPLHVGLDGMCRQLAAQARRDAVTVPDVGLTLATLADDAAAIAAAIDLPVTHRYLGQCDACGAGLYADRAAVEHDCPTPGCGAVYAVAARIADLLERSRLVVAPVQTIVTALTSLDQPVSEDRIWQWQRRGKLVAAGYVGNGERRRPLFRLGDVVDLLSRPDARRGPRAG
jgi:hypothetical protein